MSPVPQYTAAQESMHPASPETGFPTVWPQGPKSPWWLQQQIRPAWGQGEGREPADNYSYIPPSDNITGEDDWVPGAGSYYSTYQGQPTREAGVPFNSYLSNVIPSRAGRTLTYWAAAEAMLHKGVRPMIEFDCPSVQTTIRRGIVLSDPYVAELRQLGVIGPGVPATPPAWTMQGWYFQQGLARQTGAAPRPGQAGLLRGWG